MLLYEFTKQTPDASLMDALRDFLPLAVQELQLSDLPTIHLVKHIESEQPTFGVFNRNEWTITLQAVNRHPVDILRTLAHELVHSRQHTNQELHSESGETGSEHENEANAQAGVVMRLFSKKYPQYINQ